MFAYVYLFFNPVFSRLLMFSRVYLGLQQCYRARLWMFHQCVLAFTMFTPVTCFLLFTCVYLCLLVFTYVYTCLAMITPVDQCLLMFTGLTLFTRALLPMSTDVYLCFPFALVYLCLPQFTCGYLCLLVFTHFNYVCHVYSCTFTHVYSCLPMFTLV